MKPILAILFLTVLGRVNTIAQTQMEMNQIAHNDFLKVDKELNKVYSELIKLLTENEKQLLIKAQRDWIKFRDSHCLFEREQFKGGSIQPLIHSTCLAEATNNRIVNLKAAIKSREN